MKNYRIKISLQLRKYILLLLLYCVSLLKKKIDVTLKEYRAANFMKTQHAKIFLQGNNFFIGC